MVSGYDKNPDNGYSGPPPSPRDTVIFAVVMIALFGSPFVYQYLTAPAKECMTVKGTPDVIDGKQVQTLRLDTIPKGECVKIEEGK